MLSSQAVNAWESIGKKNIGKRKAQLFTISVFPVITYCLSMLWWDFNDGQNIYVYITNSSNIYILSLRIILSSVLLVQNIIKIQVTER